MNILFDKNLKFIKKKILIGTNDKKKLYEIFSPKTVNDDYLKTKISFAFPGYPTTMIQEIKDDPMVLEKEEYGLIRLELNTKTDFISKETQSLFFLRPSEDFFEISRTPNKKIGGIHKSILIKNPYALFSFKVFMANRFKEHKKELLLSVDSINSFDLGCFLGIFVSKLKEIGKKIARLFKKAGGLIKKDFTILFPLLIMLTTKLSKFPLLVAWNFIVPLVLYRFLFNRFHVIWKKGKEKYQENKSNSKVIWVHQKYIQFKIFANGVFRTCNILSV